jgi:hypothetical protein
MKYARDVCWWLGTAIRPCDALLRAERAQVVRKLFLDIASTSKNDFDGSETKDFRTDERLLRPCEMSSTLYKESTKHHILRIHQYLQHRHITTRTQYIHASRRWPL